MSYRGIYELRFTRAQGWNVEESCPGHGRRGSPARRFRLSERKSCGDLSRRKAKVWSACVLVYLAVYERPTGPQHSLSAHRRQAQPTESIAPGYSFLRRLSHCDEDVGPLAGIAADVNGLDAAAFDFDDDHWHFALRRERAPGFGRGGFHGRNGRMSLGREISQG